MLITPLAITSQDPSAQTAVNYLAGKTNFIYAGEHLYGDSLQAMLKELVRRYRVAFYNAGLSSCNITIQFNIYNAIVVDTNDMSSVYASELYVLDDPYAPQYTTAPGV